MTTGYTQASRFCLLILFWKGANVNNEINSSLPFIEGRGGVFCRGCLGQNLFSGLDLGELPIANELLRSPEGSLERFPLHLRVCSECGLGQVEDVVTPERIFRDYRYLSSMSRTFLQHASDFVDERIKGEIFEAGDWVLEIDKIRDRKSTRLNSSHLKLSRMPSSA